MDPESWTATLAYFLGTGELDNSRMSFLPRGGSRSHDIVGDHLVIAEGISVLLPF